MSVRCDSSSNGRIGTNMAGPLESPLGAELSNFETDRVDKTMSSEARQFNMGRVSDIRVPYDDYGCLT